jgi:cytochrome c oxidase cbb3-type subunit 3
VKRSLALLAAFALALLIAAQGAALAADPIRARQQYDAYCAECHGRDGHGDGPTADIQQTRPRDFADCDRMAKISDQKMIDVIRDGGYANGMSPDMPAWRYALGDQDIIGLVQRIRRFCKRYAEFPTPHRAALAAYRAHGISH